MKETGVFLSSSFSLPPPLFLSYYKMKKNYCLFL